MCASLMEGEHCPLWRMMECLKRNGSHAAATGSSEVPAGCTEL
jgi:hypothetical protein